MLLLGVDVQCRREGIQRWQSVLLVFLVERREVELREGFQAWKTGADDTCIELDQATIFYT